MKIFLQEIYHTKVSLHENFQIYGSKSCITIHTINIANGIPSTWHVHVLIGITVTYRVEHKFHHELIYYNSITKDPYSWSGLYVHKEGIYDDGLSTHSTLSITAAANNLMFFLPDNFA